MTDYNSFTYFSFHSYMNIVVSSILSFQAYVNCIIIIAFSFYAYVYIRFHYDADIVASTLSFVELISFEKRAYSFFKNT